MPPGDYSVRSVSGAGDTHIIVFWSETGQTAIALAARESRSTEDTGKTTIDLVAEAEGYRIERITRAYSPLVFVLRGDQGRR